MSAQGRARPVTLQTLAAMKAEGRKIVCLTAYTAPMARLMDDAVDLVLVGDSLGMVLYGMDSTVPVTLDMMIAHGRAVMRGAARALVVVDMPFGSYQESPEQAFRNAARVMKETGCAAVKLEGGREMAETIRFMTLRGIPVLAHIGLKPQSVNASGGYRVMGRARDEAASILGDAAAVEEAGAFGAVLECVDEALARGVVEATRFPVIGIGASAACAGQILVAEDMLGLLDSRPPRFVRQYASVHEVLAAAVRAYAGDVREGKFPEKAQVYAASNARTG